MLVVDTRDACDALGLRVADDDLCETPLVRVDRVDARAGMR